MRRRTDDILPHAPERLRLAPGSRRWRPTKGVLRVLGVGGIVLLIFVGAVRTPVQAPSLASADSTTTPAVAVSTDPSSLTADQRAKQQAALEQELADLQQQIADNEQTIAQYQTQGKTLSGDIAKLTTKIATLNLQIKAVNVALADLAAQITDTQAQINQTENRIDQHKAAIASAIQTIDLADHQNMAQILLANAHLSDFFGTIANETLVQANLRTALTEIVKLREDLLTQKENLSTQQSDAETLRAIQVSQKNGVIATQDQKQQLLVATKGKESEYTKLLAKTQATAAEIRNQIFQLLGGGQLTFEKAYEYARLAEQATGVRSAMVLAILNRESLLGKNTGRCSYQTAMNPTDVPVFLNLLSQLNIDPNSTVAMVSCPNGDGVYGGAMGPAQFIPSTWERFANDITHITGNNPPNPWNNSDAFVATALYLKQFGADDQTLASERKAAAIYYCGSRWQRSACTIYANAVIGTASQYQDDINTLNGNGGV